MEEEDAFWTLERLCINFSMESIWKPGLPGLPKCFFILEKLLDKFLPKVYQKLVSASFSQISTHNKIFSQLILDIPPHNYSTQWFITGYLYTFPFPVCLRLWDIFLFEGFHFLYAISLALFKIYEGETFRNFTEVFLKPFFN